MKKYILFSFLLSPVFLFAQNFKITGKIAKTNPRVTKVALYYARNGQNILDSVEVRNGTYTFEGMVSQPTRADLLAKYSDGKVVPRMSRDLKTIFLEPGNITVSSIDSFSNATISGSRANAEFEKLQSMAMPNLRDAQTLTRQTEALAKNNNETERRNVQAKLDAINTELKEDVYKKYFTDNPSSPIALFALQQYAGAQMDDPAEVSRLFAMLPQNVKEAGEGRRFSQLINFTQRGSIGKAAPDFTQNDINGKAVRLSAHRGSYVLLNFWASWCASCRAETRTIRSIHDKYGNDLKIISVSLDKPGERREWTEAVRKDSMNWTNVSDLQFWNNDVAVKYGISVVPQNILIDKNGRIIGRNLRGDALEARIEELLR